MNIAEIIDIGNIDAGSVTAPLFQFGFNVSGFIRKMFNDPMQKIDGISVIITGNEFPVFTCFKSFVAGFEHQIHGIPGYLKKSIIFAISIAASTIV